MRPWANHQVSYAFDALIEHIIGHAERVGEGGAFIGKAEQVLIWNNNQCVDNFLQGFNTFVSLTHALAAFKLERFGHYSDRQNAQFARLLAR
jgi:hypothetical protein